MSAGNTLRAIRAPRQPRELAIDVAKRAPKVKLADTRTECVKKQRLAVHMTRILIHPTLGHHGRVLQVFGFLCMHANKKGITRVGQDRLAMLCNCSQQNVSYAINLMIKAGFIAINHKTLTGRKAEPGGLVFPMNVYRIIYDPELTDQDVQSIAQQDASTNQYIGVSKDAPSTNPALVTPMIPENEPSPSTNGSVFPSTNPELVRTGTIKYIAPMALNGIECERLLTYWQSEAQRWGVNVVTNPDDLLVAQRLQDANVPEQRARDLIHEHYSNIEAFGSEGETRLEPILHALLQPTVQSSNGRLTT